jgi:hypothetical protein
VKEKRRRERGEREKRKKERREKEKEGGKRREGREGEKRRERRKRKKEGKRGKGGGRLHGIPEAKSRGPDLLLARGNAIEHRDSMDPGGRPACGKNRRRIQGSP